MDATLPSPELKKHASSPTQGKVQKAQAATRGKARTKGSPLVTDFKENGHDTRHCDGADREAVQDEEDVENRAGTCESVEEKEDLD